MANFALIVDLEIKPDSVDAFLIAARNQAQNSISKEPGCLRFDIVQGLEEKNKITHYEIFEDEAAFEAHAKMDHTANFGKTIESLIVKVDVKRGHLSTSLGK